MSVFQNIDPKLESLSNLLGAKLSKDRPNYPQALRKFEERRIDWVEDGIRKAIIIQPTFEEMGVNSNIWNFTNLAWIEDNGIPTASWSKFLSQGKFEVIENNIENMLDQSKENLTAISITDLNNKIP